MPVDGDIILKAGLDTTGVSKRLDSLQKTVSRGLKNVIRVGFGVRSVFALIRRLRAALVEGFGNLAQVHQPFNQAVSEILTSLNLLKNSFAAAFAPIIETVAPILAKFITMIAEAVSWIGQLIAALTGKEFVRAAAVQVDYASSVNKSAESANKATSATKKQTKAQKELNKEITHFDDLVILHDNRKDDTDTSAPVGDGGGVAPSYSFSNVPIGDAVSQFAKDFMAAWKMADFTDIGRTVGEKLKTALENIPWAKIKITLSKVAQSIATFLNGFLETSGLFTTIGKTIAEAINTAVLFVNRFVWTFHWDSLGTAIRDRIVAICSNINWDLVFSTFKGFAVGLADYLNALFDEETFVALGETVGNLIQSALLFINIFGDKFEAEKFGSSVAKGVNSAIEKINPDDVWEAAKHVIGIIKDSLTGFLGTISFDDIGNFIGTLVADAIKDIDFTASGILISLVLFSHNLFFKLLSLLVLLAPNIPWSTLGQGIVNLIAEALANFNGDSIIASLDVFVTGLCDLLKSAIATPQDAMVWMNLGHTIVNFIVDALAMLIGHVPEVIDALAGIGLSLIAGILAGIVDALVDIGTWLKTNLFDPFIAAVKSVFGIASPSTEMKPIGSFIIEGLLQGIVDALIGIADWIKLNLVDPFINAVKTTFGFGDEESALIAIGKNIIAAIKAGIGAIMTTINEWIQTNVTDKIINFFTSLLSGELFIDIGKNIIGGIKAGIGEIVSTIGEWIQTNVTDKIVGFFSSLLSGEIFIDIGKNIIGGIKDGLTKGIEGIGTWIQTHVTDPINSFFTGFWEIGSPSKVYEGYGGFLIEGLQNGMKTETTNSKDFVKTNVITTLGNFFLSLIAIIGAGIKFWLTGAGIIKNIKTGMTDNISLLTSTAATVCDDIRNSFDSSIFWYVGQNIAVGIYNGLFAHRQWLNVLAWNTAVSMYNNACRALQIASPSKKFAWIGEMVAVGLGNGVKDNQDEAINAVTDMTKAMTDEAEEVSPSVAINSSVDDWISELDNVLTTFSDMVIDKFDNLITTFAQLGNIQANVPPIAQGKVIPSSIQAANSTNDSMANMLDMMQNLQSLASDRMDISELRTLLVEMFTRYMNWSIGDEQLARHVNNGNLLLSRRYSIIKE